MTGIVKADNELLQLARSAVDDAKEKEWNKVKASREFKELVDEHLDNSSSISKKQLRRAFEQASYIVNYEPGYEADTEYPVMQEREE